MGSLVVAFASQFKINVASELVVSSFVSVDTILLQGSGKIVFDPSATRRVLQSVEFPYEVIAYGTFQSFVDLSFANSVLIAAGGSLTFRWNYSQNQKDTYNVIDWKQYHWVGITHCRLWISDIESWHLE